MNFLRSLLEDLEVLYKFRIEIFDSDGEKVDEVKVIAGHEKEAEQLALVKSTKKGKDAVSALAIDKEDIEE